MIVTFEAAILIEVEDDLALVRGIGRKRSVGFTACDPKIGPALSTKKPSGFPIRLPPMFLKPAFVLSL